LARGFFYRKIFPALTVNFTRFTVFNSRGEYWSTTPSFDAAMRVAQIAALSVFFPYGVVNTKVAAGKLLGEALAQAKAPEL